MKFTPVAAVAFVALILLCLTILPAITYSQNVDRKIADGACQCFTSMDQGLPKHQQLDNLVKACIPGVLKNWKSEIVSYHHLQDTSTSAWAEVEERLTPDVFRQMTKVCPSFYPTLERVVDSIRLQLAFSFDKELGAELVDLKKHRGVPDEEVYSQRAFLYLRLGAYETALTEATKAIEINKNFGFGYFAKAWTLNFLGDLAGASSNFLRAAELMKEPAIAFFAIVAEHKLQEVSLVAPFTWWTYDIDDERLLVYFNQADNCKKLEVITYYQSSFVPLIIGNANKMLITMKRLTGHEAKIDGTYVGAFYKRRDFEADLLTWSKALSCPAEVRLGRD